VADFHDIRKEHPDKNGRYLFDTNVIIRIATEVMSGMMKAAGKRSTFDVQPYENFLLAAKAKGASVFVSPLSLSEFAAHVERTHRYAYNARTGGDVQKNEYRAIASERSAIVAEIELGWSHVVGFAQIADLRISSGEVDSARRLLGISHVDAYDAFIVETMRQNQIYYAVSHDRDFIGVPNIIVYTALNHRS
jgi:predicted nucleic acid-binding protein